MNEEYRKGYEQAARDIFNSLENTLNSYKAAKPNTGWTQVWAIDVAMSYAREALKIDPFGDKGYLKNE